MLYFTQTRRSVITFIVVRDPSCKMLLPCLFADSLFSREKSSFLTGTLASAKNVPSVPVPVLLSTLQLLRSRSLRNELVGIFLQLLRFRCLSILPDPLRFVKGFAVTFLAVLKTHLVRASGSFSTRISLKARGVKNQKIGEQFRGATLAWHKGELNRCTESRCLLRSMTSMPDPPVTVKLFRSFFSETIKARSRDRCPIAWVER